MALIEIKGLTKDYGRGDREVRALRGVDLSVEAGEIFGVIGLSGAGKSTLIRCLNRLETPGSGTVTVDGRLLTGLNEAELRLARQEMGMIFQHFNLLSSRTVTGNVAFPMEIAGRGSGEIKPRVAELLDLVGLRDKAQVYPAQLSGGQKQRVGIARALANSPKILLCDEATSALDPQTTQSILALIQDIKERLGLTVVLITHEMRVITEICDRVAVMEDGLIVESGPVIEVFTRPRHPTTRAFVESVISREDSSRKWGYQPRGTLARILFIGPAAGEPVISRLVRLFKVEANILQGDIGHLQGQPFGVILIDLVGEPAARRQALDYLESLNLPVELLEGAA
ncbi:MAG: methionine ABC transporter ATP-binding protein [Candidatus Adiutrix sp.]|jgi:D-methionine transport system ATP-binding protein|nr:methionine ABC transporter ATP-binding protein [Candidatus Adiutrix sp.]